MHDHKDRFEAAVETFQNSSGMTEREAEAFVLRVLDGIHRQAAADRMGISKSTVDKHVHAAKQKVRLPHIDEVVRVSPRNTGTDEGRAYEIRFPNGALLRYVWNGEKGEIVESVNRADDPISTYRQFGVGGSEEELAEYALESISEYTRVYRDDWEACRKDWPHVFEALTGYKS